MVSHGKLSKQVSTHISKLHEHPGLHSPAHGSSVADSIHQQEDHQVQAISSAAAAADDWTDKVLFSSATKADTPKHGLNRLAGCIRHHLATAFGASPLFSNVDEPHGRQPSGFNHDRIR